MSTSKTINFFAPLLAIATALPGCYSNDGLDTNTSTTAATSESTDAPTSSTAEDPSTGPAPFCGDGLVSADEACDDGNQDDADECTNACTLATCGDGIRGPGEACDDGDDDDANACSNACILASCGDGIVQTGEECDDGEATATCDADCTHAACGDGLVNAQAGEACVDANLDPGDRCSSTCASTEITHLAVGGNFVCVAFTSGTARCWGQGEYGVIGQGVPDDRGNDPGELPVPDIPLAGRVIDLSSGTYHVCALLDTGAVTCWGNNWDGQLGNGTNQNTLGTWPDDMPSPPVVMADDAKATAVFTGHHHSCAIMTNKRVRCWGLGYNGALGYGDTNSRKTADADIPDFAGVEQLVLGTHFTCALHGNGGVRCWGDNTFGQLGLEDTMMRTSPPADPIDLGGPAVEITAGTWYACARMEDGSVRCWGNNAYSQLGNGETSHVGATPGSMPPQAIDFGDDSPSTLAAGSNNGCAVLSDGSVRCWGLNLFGSLGYGDGKNYKSPPDKTVDLGGPVSLIDAGVGANSSDLGYTTCALLTADGSLRCWGNNTYGQLGLGHDDIIGDDETPIAASVPF